MAKRLFADPRKYQIYVSRSDEKTMLADHIQRECNGSKEKKVLDLGCGFGANLPVLAEVFGGEHVVALEPSRQFDIAEEQEIAGVTYIRDMFEHFDEQNLDFVLASHVLQYQGSDPKTFIKKMYNQLAPGGEVWIVQHTDTGIAKIIRHMQPHLDERFKDWKTLKDYVTIVDELGYDYEITELDSSIVSIDFADPSENDKRRLEFILGIDSYDLTSSAFREHLGSLTDQFPPRKRISHPNGIIKIKKSAKVFSSNPIMSGYATSAFDNTDIDFGHSFTGRRVITADGFATLDEIVCRIKAEKKWKVVLHIGDSSTSGWNANKMYKGSDPLAAFFTYKTYPTLLEEKIEAHCINAGVPGYTSLQGRKHVAYLLKELRRLGVGVDYVTIYLGNNDSVCGPEDKVRIDFMDPSLNHAGERVPVADYKLNMTGIIKTIRAYGTKPIIIMPPQNYNREPGIRSALYRQESEEVLEQWKNEEEKERLLQARRLYKIGRLKEAYEMDRTLPGMKSAYKRALRWVAFWTRTPVITVQDPSFLDYCHPDERICGLIAERIKDIIWEDYRKGPDSFLYRKKRKNGELSPNIYAGIV